MSESVFPLLKTWIEGRGEVRMTEPGLTKRELFAALIMAAYATKPAQSIDPEDVNKTFGEYWAENAVYCADVLLAALAKAPAPPPPDEAETIW